MTTQSISTEVPFAEGMEAAACDLQPVPPYSARRWVKAWLEGYAEMRRNIATANSPYEK